MIIAPMRRRPLYAMLVEHFLAEISAGRLRSSASHGSFVSPRTPVWTISSIEDVVQVGAETDVEIIDWRPVHDAAAARRLGRPDHERVIRYRGVRSDMGAPVYYVEAFTLAAIGRKIRRGDFGRSTLLEIIENKLGLPVARARRKSPRRPWTGCCPGGSASRLAARCWFWI